MAKQNAIANKGYSLYSDTTVTGTTLQTGFPASAASCVTLNGTTLLATGTDANVGISLTPKGTGSINLTTSIPSGSVVPVSGIVYRGIVAGGWSSSEWHTEQHTLQTVGATPTAIVSIPLAQIHLMVSVKILMNGFQDDWTDCVGGEILCTAYRAAGNIVLVGAPIINVNYTDTIDTSDIDATIDVGTNTLNFLCIGAAAQNWNWVATVTYMYTISNL